MLVSRPAAAKEDVAKGCPLRWSIKKQQARSLLSENSRECLVESSECLLQFHICAALPFLRERAAYPDDARQNLLSATQRCFCTDGEIDNPGFIEAQGSGFIRLQPGHVSERPPPVRESTLARQIVVSSRELRPYSGLPIVDPAHFVSRLDENIVNRKFLLNLDVMDRSCSAGLR